MILCLVVPALVKVEETFEEKAGILEQKVGILGSDFEALEVKV